MLAQLVAPLTGALRRLQAIAVLDRAGSAQPLRQQPGLIVKTLRIELTTRALELHRQPPILAGLHGGPGMPGNTQACRQLGAPRLHILQFKAPDALTLLRQTSHSPFQPQGATIQFRRQALLQSLPGAQACPGKTQQHPAQRIEQRTQ